MGKKVLLYNSKLRLFQGKLRSKIGPFLITEISPHGAVEIQNMSTGTQFKVNAHRLKHYLESHFGPQEVVSFMTWNDYAKDCKEIKAAI